MIWPLLRLSRAGPGADAKEFAVSAGAHHVYTSIPAEQEVIARTVR